MNISILGTGNMATGLAVLFAKAGHTVTLGSRDAEKAKAVASKSGNGIVGAELADAAGKADLVVLAVPFDAAADVISAAGDLSGKILVDITNPMTADYSASDHRPHHQRRRRNPEARAHGQGREGLQHRVRLGAPGRMERWRAVPPPSSWPATTLMRARPSRNSPRAPNSRRSRPVGSLPPGTWSRSRVSTSRSPTASAKAPTSPPPGSALPELISHKQGSRS